MPGKEPWLEQTALFTAGKDGYHTYRIPALIVTQRGTILALCEGRKYGRSDAGKIDLVLRRSLDGGVTWGEMQVVAAEQDMTCGNPCPVVDQVDGTIWLPFCKNLGDGGQSLIMAGQAPRSVWVTRSTDDGATWDTPAEITAAVKDPAWHWYATGPGHGIQTGRGRLVIPCDHGVGVNWNRDDPYHSHVIYSDDHGATWHCGGSAQPGTDESAIVQTAGGALYLNARSSKLGKRRLYAWSYDEGGSFTDMGTDESLIEPECEGSLVRFTHAGQHDRDRVLFANPASSERVKMTVRLSYDECRTWPVARVLHAGPSAYSDLCIAPGMSICCLYERGEQHPYESLALARFNLEWLTDGADWV